MRRDRNTPSLHAVRLPYFSCWLDWIYVRYAVYSILSPCKRQSQYSFLADDRSSSHYSLRVRGKRRSICRAGNTVISMPTILFVKKPSLVFRHREKLRFPVRECNFSIVSLQPSFLVWHSSYCSTALSRYPEKGGKGFYLSKSWRKIRGGIHWSCAYSALKYYLWSVTSMLKFFRIFFSFPENNH